MKRIIDTKPKTCITKRNLDICTKCDKFIQWNMYANGRMSCGVVLNEMIFPFKMTKERFENSEVSDECIYKTEYCIEQWNSEEKTGDLQEMQ